MQRILIVGYVLMEYLGEKPILYRGRVPVGSRKYIEVKKGDIVVADEVTAIAHCRGTQWRRVESGVDIAPLFASEQKEPIQETDVEPIQETDVEPIQDNMTQSNLDEFSDEELIAFAKAKKIGGITKRSARDKVISLILPYLPE